MVMNSLTTFTKTITKTLQENQYFFTEKENISKLNKL